MTGVQTCALPDLSSSTVAPPQEASGSIYVHLLTLKFIQDRCSRSRPKEMNVNLNGSTSGVVRAVGRGGARCQAMAEGNRRTVKMVPSENKEDSGKEAVH